MKKIFAICTIILIICCSLCGCETRRERLEREAYEAKQEFYKSKEKLNELKARQAVLQSIIDAYERK